MRDNLTEIIVIILIVLLVVASIFGLYKAYEKHDDKLWNGGHCDICSMNRQQDIGLIHHLFMFVKTVVREQKFKE